jgi:hypothetical protein
MSYLKQGVDGGFFEHAEAAEMWSVESFLDFGVRTSFVDLVYV